MGEKTPIKKKTSFSPSPQSQRKFTPLRQINRPQNQQPTSNPPDLQEYINHLPDSKIIQQDFNHQSVDINSLSPNHPIPPQNPSANSTPTRTDSERRSFQGDHHRHRYMSYSTSPSIRPSPQSARHSNSRRARPSPSSQKFPSPQSISSPSQRPSPQISPHTRQKPSASSPQISPTARQKPLSSSSPHISDPHTRSHQPNPRLLNPVSTQHHLGAPTNAHYSPHYGSSAQRVPTSKRKPPPSLNPSSPDAQPQPPSHTPQQSPSPRSQPMASHSPEPSPSRSHRSVAKLTKSRSPSPSPRSGGLAKKIGSVLSAPFRRGSDASEIGYTLHDLSKMGAVNLNANILAHTNCEPNEHLPLMPTAGHSSPAGPAAGRVFQDPHSNRLTLAQQIIHETRSREAMSIVPESPERVLRVVNGTATTSTKASQDSNRPPLDRVFNPSSCEGAQPVDSTHHPSRSSFQSSRFDCLKCVDLEHKWSIEIDRSRALERALEEQTNKLEQLRNWSTAKVTTLDHALKSQERMLQEVERRIYESSDRPGIKSEYLIALQKDLIELNARLAALEGKRLEDDVENDENCDSNPPRRSRNESHASSYETRDLVSSPTPSTSFGRMTPLSSCMSQLEAEEKSPGRKSGLRTGERYSSTPPLNPHKTGVSGKQTPEKMTTPRQTASWKASSPANMASKLVPPQHGLPGSPNKSPNSNTNRSTPVTPSSRSPRPRYTSALGIKATSPLANSKMGTLSEPVLPDPGSPTPARPGSVGAGTTKATGVKYRQPFEVLSQTTGHGFLNQSSTPISNRHGSSVFHSKRISTIHHYQNIPHRAQSEIAGPTKPLFIAGQAKKPVGDLIKLFDGTGGSK